MSTYWTDPAVRHSPMRQSQLRALRLEVDTALAGVGFSYPWTWPVPPSSPVPGQEVPIRAKYLVEINEALGLLWSELNRGPLPPWSSGVEPRGASTGDASDPSRSEALDLTFLRASLGSAVDFPDPKPTNGVDSLSFAADSDSKPQIQTDWANEVRAFSEQPFYVRCNLRAPVDSDGVRQDFTPADKSALRSALSRYTSRNPPIRVFTVFTREFYGPTSHSPMAELDEARNPDGTPSNPETYFTNHYIRGFADRAKEMVDALRQSPALATDFIIWNEPNVGNSGSLDARHFAALLRRCWQRITTSHPSARVHWGGIFTLPGNSVDPSNVAYISGVYAALRDAGLAGAGIGPWPWSAINIHIHRVRPASQIQDLFAQVSAAKSEFGDGNSGTIVGEWGITLEDYLDNPSRLSTLYSRIHDHPDAMFFFSHQAHYEADAGQWGLRYFSIIPGSFLLEGKTSFNFFGSFDSLVG